MHRLRHHRCCCHRCRRCGPDCLRCGAATCPGGGIVRGGHGRSRLAAAIAAPIALGPRSAATCPGGGIVRGALRATGVVALQLRLRPQSRCGPDRLRGICMAWQRQLGSGQSRTTSTDALRATSASASTLAAPRRRRSALPVPPQRLSPSEPRPRPLVPSDLRLPSPPPTQRAPSSGPRSHAPAAAPPLLLRPLPALRPRSPPLWDLQPPALAVA